MCGIVGSHDYLGGGLRVEPERADRMVDALAHRGPDGRGVWQAPGIFLGHRRLAILDPTPAGAQPMHLPTHGLSITFNGEIYNYRELQHELETRGFRFHTGCDTEVILAAYAAWGTAAVHKMNGIFAWALWDAPRRRLWLVRDRLGVKPLYYSLADQQLRFASEAKGILADPTFARRPNFAGIDAFLSFGYIPAPETGFEGLKQLPPAHEMVLEEGRVWIKPYWRLSMAEEPLSAKVAQEQFAEQLHAAVKRQMVSDVPIGAFLSGGIDSTAIVAEMADLSDQPVRTFSVGFRQASFDERSAAAETAQKIGTQHQEILVELDVVETVDKYLAQCDDPFADSSSLAVYHLCKAASQQVKVALSGDGADELLAGYPTYSATQLAAGYRWIPGIFRSLIHDVVDAIPASNERYSWHQFASRFVMGAEEPEGRDFASWRIHFNDVDKAELCRPEFLDEQGDPIGQYAACYHEAPDAGNRLKKMLHADLSFYLPSDMLVKVDRMSMAHGLEVRVPFLDHEFVEFCAKLPSRLLARLPFTKKNKLILRRHLRNKLGPSFGKRRKTGFNVPIEQALRGDLWPRFYDAVSSSRFMQEGPFDVPKLLKHAAQHAIHRIDAGHALFSAMVLADWWDRWLKPGAISTPIPAPHFLKTPTTVTNPSGTR